MHLGGCASEDTAPIPTCSRGADLTDSQFLSARRGWRIPDHGHSDGARLTLDAGGSSLAISLCADSASALLDAGTGHHRCDASDRATRPVDHGVLSARAVKTSLDRLGVMRVVKRNRGNTIRKSAT